MGKASGRSLEETPTWAVATVCFVLIVISIIIEQTIEKIGHWLKKKHKNGLYESLQKIKAELMLLGFISLLLTVGTTQITRICISESAASSWLPCSQLEIDEDKKDDTTSDEEIENRRRRLLGWSSEMMLQGDRRMLGESSSRSGGDTCEEQGKVSFMSYDGVHQLHIFIFVLTVSHVFYCVLTMALGRLKMRNWKRWESEIKTPEYQFSHDSKRFRFTRDTSFGRRHMSSWSKSPILLWIVCFYRQFVRSVPKVDYLTLRHGFIIAHLAPHSHSSFDFASYINRSLEEDFKVVVEISPPIWLFAVAFLLFSTHGWYSYLWLPFVPLIIVLIVGTKLQVIITKMGLKFQDRGVVIKGEPVVQPGDDLFWFNRPRLLLHLLNFVLFQNAFQFAFFSWTSYQFGLNSCFHEHTEDIIIRITMGVTIQILCSYVTLPLYALVTQMGSTMRPTVFNERVATAIRRWHHTARKNIKENKKSSGQMTPMSSRPGTPSNVDSLSPVHLLGHYRTNMDNLQISSPRLSEYLDPDGSSSPTYPISREPSFYHEIELSYIDEAIDQQDHEPGSSQVALYEIAPIERQQAEVTVRVSKDFSFDKRPNTVVYD
uniref:MLO-like protein 6 n=1 Tax=Erigeron canadensis TaxID=72917 RepID=UPI001CB92057|nr:MLO-like protein 6 [Erigeron canadensis]